MTRLDLFFEALDGKGQCERYPNMEMSPEESRKPSMSKNAGKKRQSSATCVLPRVTPCKAYILPAVRSVQAGREVYTASCTLGEIPKMMQFNPSELPARMRAQRRLNKSRIPDIATYLAENQSEYVLSALTASINGEVRFEPIDSKGNGSSIGYLHISAASQILINDGQHRRAAIEIALKQNPRLRFDSVPVVFFVDAGLKRSQQIFTDLNKYAIRPNRSLSILYDRRNQLAHLCLDIIDDIPLLRELTNLEKTSLSIRESQLFTLSGVYEATKAMLGKRSKSTRVHRDEREFATAFWQKVVEVMSDWNQAFRGEVSCSHLRKSYVHSHALFLSLIGHLGRDLRLNTPDRWQEILGSLQNIDWSRSSPAWQSRIMNQGRLLKSHTNIQLALIFVKQQLGLHLNESESEVEKEFQDRERHKKA